LLGLLAGPGHWSLGSTLGGSTVDVPLSTSTALATRDELFSANEQLALAGFLAGYSGLTRDAYTLDLRQYVAWCTEHRVAVFGARRADIECFARHLESLGRARATIARRLCTVACFYRYAEQEGLIAVSPGGARASTPPGLRVPRQRPGPQRGRRPAGRRGAGRDPGITP
jgi:Phage integrase, N-terminal SAM-like domain